MNLNTKVPMILLSLALSLGIACSPPRPDPVEIFEIRELVARHIHNIFPDIDYAFAKRAVDAVKLEWIRIPTPPPNTGLLGGLTTCREGRNEPFHCTVQLWIWDQRLHVWDNSLAHEYVHAILREKYYPPYNATHHFDQRVPARVQDEVVYRWVEEIMDNAEVRFRGCVPWQFWKYDLAKEICRP